MSRRLRREDYTVGWICALSLELAAAKAMLDENHQALESDGDNDQNVYALGSMGEHNIVIGSLPNGEYGTNSAAAVATQMRASFRGIRFGLMVGIGGGVPSHKNDIRLGDVVVSQPQHAFGGVIQYDMGKTLANGERSHFERTGSLNAPPRILLNAISMVQANEVLDQSQLLNYLAELDRYPKFSRSRTAPDVLFQAAYDHERGDTCDGCRREYEVFRQPRENQVVVHYGLIASANQVMKDARERDRTSDALGGVLCFEMEAAGLMNNFPCLVIRGICDYSDSHKQKTWQHYAAATAAAYAKEVLSVIPPTQVASTTTVNDEIRRSSVVPSSLGHNKDLPSRTHDDLRRQQEDLDLQFAKLLAREEDDQHEWTEAGRPSRQNIQGTYSGLQAQNQYNEKPPPPPPRPSHSYNPSLDAVSQMATPFPSTGAESSIASVSYVKEHFPGEKYYNVPRKAPGPPSASLHGVQQMASDYNPDIYNSQIPGSLTPHRQSSPYVENARRTPTPFQSSAQGPTAQIAWPEVSMLSILPTLKAKKWRDPATLLGAIQSDRFMRDLQRVHPSFHAFISKAKISDIPEILQVLLRCRLNPNDPQYVGDYGSELGSNPHMWILHDNWRILGENARYEVFKLLVQYGADVARFQTKNGRTALHRASGLGLLDCVLLIISKGANVNWETSTTTPLHLATFQNKAEIVDCLLKHGARTDMVSGDYDQPLLEAAWRGFEATARVLLRGRADVNARMTKHAGVKGATPIMVAACQGHFSVVKLILDTCGQYVDMNVKTIEDGYTALHGVVDTRNNLGVNSMTRYNIVQLLLQHGASANAIDIRGQSLLHWAAYNNLSQIMRLLISHGASTEIVDQTSFTPLLRAVGEGHVDAVRILIENGAKVAPEPGRCRSAMEIARYFNKPEMVAELQRYFPGTAAHGSNGPQAYANNASIGYSATNAYTNYGGYNG